MRIWILEHPFLTLNIYCKKMNSSLFVQFLSKDTFGNMGSGFHPTRIKAVAFATRTRLQVNLYRTNFHSFSNCHTVNAGWSSSLDRPSSFSNVRYVLEPGEYVWFLQADASLTDVMVRSQYRNQSFFFEGSNNVSQFSTQLPLAPPCRNFVALVRIFPK
jgi:hypothetical protein